MFKKWSSDSEHTAVSGNGDRTEKESVAVLDTPPKTGYESSVASHGSSKKTNTILKGSSLKGDIIITSDLELSGEVEGNIRSEQDSNIILKGTCKGNIETKDGSVNIDGALEGGNIAAGKDVTISGKFNGGEVKAGGKIFINGEFNGRLEANEIEIGSNASGKGELHYREFISIARGAKVQVQIGQKQPELKVLEKARDKKAEDIKPEKIEPKSAK